MLRTTYGKVFGWCAEASSRHGNTRCGEFEGCSRDPSAVRGRASPLEQYKVRHEPKRSRLKGELNGFEIG